MKKVKYLLQQVFRWVWVSFLSLFLCDKRWIRVHSFVEILSSNQTEQISLQVSWQLVCLEILPMGKQNFWTHRPWHFLYFFRSSLDPKVFMEEPNLSTDIILLFFTNWIFMSNKKVFSEKSCFKNFAHPLSEGEISKNKI